MSILSKFKIFGNSFELADAKAREELTDKADKEYVNERSQGFSYDEAESKLTFSGAIGGGSGMHVYSTEEKNVGEWIDGKNIYEKTIVLSEEISLPSNTWTDVLSNFGIERIIDVKCMNTSSASLAISATISYLNNIQLLNYRNGTVGVRYIVLQYTKTTD